METTSIMEELHTSSYNILSSTSDTTTKHLLYKRLNSSFFHFSTKWCLLFKWYLPVEWCQPNQSSGLLREPVVDLNAMMSRQTVKKWNPIPTLLMEPEKGTSATTVAVQTYLDCRKHHGPSRQNELIKNKKRSSLSISLSSFNMHFPCFAQDVFT